MGVRLQGLRRFGRVTLIGLALGGAAGVALEAGAAFGLYVHAHGEPPFWFVTLAVGALVALRVRCNRPRRRPARLPRVRVLRLDGRARGGQKSA